MKELVKIDLMNPKLMRFTLTLTTFCPYSCRYCPDSLHTGTNQDINLDSLKQFFNKFLNRERILIITGGECTMHPQFKDVVTLAKTLDIKVLVDTNSVRTARFYEEVAAMVDVWNVTLHPSQHQLDLEKIAVLTDSSFVVVYVMMDPDFWNIAVDWFDQLKQIQNIKIIPLRVISDWGGASCTVDYTQEELDFLSKNPFHHTFTKERENEIRQSHSWLESTDAVATYSTGETVNLDPYELLKQGTNKFTGWKCYAGNEALMINPDSSVTWANCGIKVYKNLDEVNPVELISPITCTRRSCDCGTDIRSTKALK